MLDVREYDHEIQTAAEAATLASVMDTTARALDAVLADRAELVGRRTLFVVKELLEAFESLRERSSDFAESPGQAGIIFKNRGISSGVGNLLGERDTDEGNGAKWRAMLDLSSSVAADDESVVVSDPEKCRELVRHLRRYADALTRASAETFADTQSSYRE